MGFAPVFNVQPLYYILGSYYPKRYDLGEKFYQSLSTFDYTFWCLLSIVLTCLPLLILWIKQCSKGFSDFRVRQGRWASHRRRYSERLGFYCTKYSHPSFSGKKKFVSYSKLQFVKKKIRKHFKIVKKCIKCYLRNWPILLTSILSAQSKHYFWNCM